MPNSHHEHLEKRYHAKLVRRRLSTIIGFCILLTGYALLAISPDTPTDWVLIRVVVGFGFLFVGFAVAILPMLSRLTGGDD